MGGQKKQNCLQFVNFIEKVYQTLRTMRKDRKKTNNQKIQYSTMLGIFFLPNINHCSNVQLYLFIALYLKITLRLK